MKVIIILLILLIICYSVYRYINYEKKLKEKTEAESKAKAEQEAKAKAEQEAKEKAEQEAKVKAEQEAKEKAEQEAKEKAEQEAKEKAEQEAKEKAEQEAKEKAEQEAKEKAEQEAKEKAEQEAKAKAEAEIKNNNPGTFTFSFGGSECTVTANEAVKNADRKCHRYRSPIMNVSENVNYKIESPDGYDVSVGGPKGLTIGTFNANTNYVIYCAALEPGIEKFVKITLLNKSGTKIINYRCYSPNFEVNYKNSTNVNISNIKCNIVYDNGDKRKSTYEWSISAGKEKSDSWIDNSHNNIKEISNITVNGKTMEYEISGVNTKEITIIIK